MPLLLIAIAIGATIVGVVAAMDRRMQRRIDAEVEALFADLPAGRPAAISEAELETLPAPVGRYLRLVVEPGRPAIRCTRLRQTGTMWLAPGASPKPFTAVQYFSAEPPAFIWHARLSLLPRVWVSARDRYYRRSGNMLIKPLSTVTIGDESGPGLTTASFIRFVAEAMWFPTAFARASYLHWEAIDDRSARALVDDGGVTASLVFHFDDDGHLARVESPDRMRESADPGPTPWYGEVWDYRTFDGVRVPTRARVSWVLESGEFTYWEARLTDLEHDRPERY